MQMQAVMGLGKRPLGVADDAILRALGRYHYLTARQVCRLLYSHGSLSYVQTTLKNLVDCGYLLRLMLPRAVQHGSSPFVHALGRSGMGYLRSQGIDVRSRWRPSEEREHQASLLFLAHTLLVNDFLIGAELLSRRWPALSLEEVVHERELRREPFYVVDEGRRHPVIPDAWLDLHLGGSTQLCLSLEADRGTEEQRSWRRKVRGLLAYARGPYQERFETTSLTVAVVTTAGEGRLANLLRWTCAELAGRAEADLFRFTALSPEGAEPEDLFLSPCWYRPHTPYPLALIEGGGGEQFSEVAASSSP